jgi:hypothetical protein
MQQFEPDRVGQVRFGGGGVGHFPPKLVCIMAARPWQQVLAE